MRSKRKIAAIGLSALTVGLQLQNSSASPSSDADGPIQRLHEIRKQYLEVIGHEETVTSKQREVAQFWGNFPNFPNWPNWSNWFNGWRNY